MISRPFSTQVLWSVRHHTLLRAYLQVFFSSDRIHARLRRPGVPRLFLGGSRRRIHLRRIRNQIGK